MNVYVVCQGQLHGLGVQYLGAASGQGQHIPQIDAGKLPGAGNQPGISGVNAVHIGIDLAAVGLQSGSEGHRRGVGAAPAQGADVALGGEALKAGDHRHTAPAQGLLEPAGGNEADVAAAVPGTGENPRLPAGEGLGLDPQALQHDGHQGGGLLLPGGHQRVQLPL